MKKRNDLLVVFAFFMCVTVSHGQVNYEKRINCGQASGDTTYDSKTFSPDDPTNQGFEYTGDSKTTNGHSNFTLGSVFEPTRYTQLSSMKYEFPVDNGTYQVILYLAEPYHGPQLSGSASNTRQFDIDIENGQYAVSDLIVYEVAGNVANGIYIIDEEVDVTDGKVTITFIEGSGNDPIISAIEVLGVATGGGTTGGHWTQETNNDLHYTAGKVGIGTTTPLAILDVGTTLQQGELGTVMARLSEGNASGDGTYLGIKGYDTQGSGDIKSFSLEHSFYGITNGALNFYRGTSSSDGYMTFSTSNGTERVRIDSDGNMGIGTSNPDAPLTVNGRIHATEVLVDLAVPAPDYVFLADYNLRTLGDVSKYIDEHGHLPNMPSALEMETEGIELGKMDMRLLEKIEELTLYILEQEKRILELETKSNK